MQAASGLTVNAVPEWLHTSAHCCQEESDGNCYNLTGIWSGD